MFVGGGSGRILPTSCDVSINKQSVISIGRIYFGKGILRCQISFNLKSWNKFIVSAFCIPNEFSVLVLMVYWTGNLDNRASNDNLAITDVFFKNDYFLLSFELDESHTWKMPSLNI